MDDFSMVPDDIAEQIAAEQAMEEAYDFSL